MENNDGKRPFFLRQETDLQKAQRHLSSLITDYLALVALLSAKGVIRLEELEKMVPIMGEARRTLGGDFTVEQGMKAVQAAFHIEGGEG